MAKFDSVGMDVESITPGIKCHMTKYSSLVTRDTYTYFGHLRLGLYRYGLRMKENGIILMIKAYKDYIFQLYTLKQIRKRIIEEENSRTVPFKMTDWKILSIFVVWTFMLGVSFIVLILEMVYKIRRWLLTNGQSAIMRACIR